MISTANIREHMPVVDSRGNHVGTVDHLEGTDQIKLTKSDSKDASHHYIPLDWVNSVDDSVHLSKTVSEIAEKLQ